MTSEYQVQLPDGAVAVDPDTVEDVDYDDTMTEERAAELVDAVRSSPSYHKARLNAKMRRGRPALSPEGSDRITARIPVGQHTALRRAAAQRGTTVGAVVREAVDEYLRTHAS